MTADSNKPDYGNWIPKTVMLLIWTVFLIGVVSFVLVHFYWPNVVLYIASGLIVIVVGVFGAYYTYARKVFSFDGGQLMSKIHDRMIIDNLHWDGQGSAIDIGCGSGALSIKLAKKYPEATIQGVDYWGAGWDYAKEMCEKNASIEGVSNTVFTHGDACHLDFADETFDAAVSNFVFHEVRNEPDKKKLIREALRVVKKGGCFCFHDLFEAKNIYGDFSAFVEELRSEGYEITYIPHTENDPIYPDRIRSPLMMYNLGVVYGRKPL